MPESERPRPFHARLIRKLARVLAWMLIGVAGLVALAWLVLVVFFPDDKIRRMLVDALEEELGVPVQAGELDLEILSGLVLRDVSLGPPPGFAEPPVRIERLVADYTLAGILGKKITVHRLVVERPLVRLVATDQGTNLAALFGGKGRKEAPSAGEAEEAEDGEEGGFVLDLSAVEIRDARVVVDVPGLKADLSGLRVGLRGRLGSAGATALALEASLKRPAEPNFVVTAAGGALAPGAAALGFDLQASLDGRDRLESTARILIDVPSAPGPTRQVDIGLRAEADLGAGQARLHSLSLALDGETLLKASGEMNDLDGDPTGRLTIERFVISGRLLNGLVAGLLPGFTGAGRLRIDGATLAGKLEGPPAATARLVIEDGRVAGKGMDLANLAGRLDLSLEPGDLGGVLRIDSDLRIGSFRENGLSAHGMAIAVQGAAPIQLEDDRAVLRPDEVRVHLGAESLELPGRLRITRPEARIRLEAAQDPVRVGPDGIQVPDLTARLQGGCERASIAGARLRSVALQGRVQTGGMTSEPHGVKASRLAAELVADARRLQFPGGVANRLRTRLAASAQDVQLTTPLARPWQIEGTLDSGSTLIAGLVFEKLHGRLASRTKGSGLTVLPVDLKVTLAGLTVERGHEQDPLRLPGSVDLGLAGIVRPGGGKVEVARFTAAAAGLLDLEARGELDWRSRRGSTSLHLRPISLEKVVALVPEPYRKDLPPLTGQVEVTTELSGRIPATPGELELGPYEASATVRLEGVGLRLERPSVRARGWSGTLSAKASGPGSRQLSARVDLQGERVLIVGPAVVADGLTIKLGAVHQADELSLQGGVTAGSLHASRVMPLPLRAPSIEVEAKLLGMKEWRIRRFQARLPSMGLGFDLSGRFQRAPGAEGWKGVKVESRLEAKLASASQVILPGGLVAQGRGEFSLDLESRPGGVLAAGGSMRFDDFTLQGGGFALQGVRGAIPVSQLIATRPVPGLLAGRIGREDAAEADSASTSRAYQEALLPMKGRERSFSLASVRFEDLTFHDLSGNLELSGGRLTLGSLRFGFLQGDVLADAQIAFAPPGTRRVQLDAEMSGVDLSGLGALSFTGASDISGNLRLGVDMGEKVFSTAANLTRIGRSTLQAVLASIDPTETNPGVLELRKFLSKHKVSPRRVSLTIRHGLLGMEVVFHEMGFTARAAAGLIQGFSGDTYRLKHLPVSGLLSKYLGF